jgi:hypothetical protein
MNPRGLIVAWGAVLLVGGGTVAGKTLRVDRVWVAIRPVQCLGNPWEKDWLAKHHNRAWRYPSRKEPAILKAYFKKKGVQILDLRVKPYQKSEPLCRTCDCARGDTLLLLIRAQDSLQMGQWGYTDRIPYEPQKPPKHEPSSY